MAARVLVVEDEALIRDTIDLALRDEGYEVRAAANGRDALDVLESWCPDVIVLDLMMPVMDGWTFRAAQLRRPPVADVPIIVLSGAREAPAAVEQLSAEVAIRKPFDLLDVLNTVASVVTRRRRSAAGNSAK